LEGSAVEPHEWPFSQHLIEDPEGRRIPESWIRRTVRFPDRRRREPDGTVHYIKASRDFGGRYLRVITNPDRQLILTAFFDRRLGRRQYRRGSNPP
jgi:hypothetical protein